MLRLPSSVGPESCAAVRPAQRNKHRDSASRMHFVRHGRPTTARVAPSFAGGMCVALTSGLNESSLWPMQVALQGGSTCSALCCAQSTTYEAPPNNEKAAPTRGVPNPSGFLKLNTGLASAEKQSAATCRCNQVARTKCSRGFYQ